MRKLKLKNIIVPESFKETPPNESKMNTARECYKRFDYFITPVVLSDNNVLLDGYTTYLVAKENNLTDVPFKRGQLETIEGIHEGGNKLYEWKIAPSERGKVQAGQEVSVWTQYGVARVQVIRIKTYSHVEPDKPLRSMRGAKTIFRGRSGRQRKMSGRGMTGGAL